MGQIDEEGEPFRGQLAQVGRHQNFGDLVEIAGQRQVAHLGLHQVEVLAQQDRQTEGVRVGAADVLLQGLNVAAGMGVGLA